MTRIENSLHGKPHHLMRYSSSNMSTLQELFLLLTCHDGFVSDDLLTGVAAIRTALAHRSSVCQ